MIEQEFYKYLATGPYESKKHEGNSNSFHSTDSSIIDSISNSNSNLIDQINDLNKLKEQGIISDEEFKKAKEKILN